MPLKTLHLTNSWHEKSGGIATFYRALINEANRRKHTIRLVVPGEKSQIQELSEFARIYHIEAPRSLLNSNYRTIYPTQFLCSTSKLQEILVAERPHLVEICDKYTLNYLGPLLRNQLLRGVTFRPVVVGLSCERMDDNFRTYLGNVPLAKAFCSWYMKWLYFPFFDHHIANSHYTVAELGSAAQGQLVERGTWIRHMGVDLDRLSPDRRSEAMRHRLLQYFAAAENSVLLLYIGRLVPEKNLSLLFNLLIYLDRTSARDFRLLVVGDGMERKRWEEVAGKRIPGRVVFLGHVQDRDVLADIYSNADLFLHPNPREPFGIAPLEAMASGLPLIAPNSGGITSYANVDNAWVVAPTTEHFAAAVHEALSNGPLRAARIKAALETARQYEWSRVASSFLDLYGELHRAALNPSQALPSPLFYSTPVAGRGSRLMRTVSATAVRLFKIASGRRFESRAAAQASNMSPKS